MRPVRGPGDVIWPLGLYSRGLPNVPGASNQLARLLCNYARHDGSYRPTRRVVVGEDAARADEVGVEIGDNKIKRFHVGRWLHGFDARRAGDRVQQGSILELFGHSPTKPVHPQWMAAGRA